MKYSFKAVLWMLLFIVSMPAYAERETDDNQDEINDDKKVEVGIHAGMTNVQGNERVYDKSHKVSELLWDTKQAYMLGANASVVLDTSKNLKFNASFSTAVAKGNSTMDDYDWLLVGADWTHWSHHENTTLEKGLIMDIGFSQAIHNNHEKGTNWDILFGFKKDQWRWQAVGGSYIYSSGPNSLRDTVGTFVNVPGITYEQTIETPYIGVAFDWKKERMRLGFKVIGSFLASAKTVDHHHLRDLTFTDNFKKGKMLGEDARGRYSFCL